MGTESQIDTLKLDISIIEKNTAEKIDKLTQSLEGLYNRLSDINKITSQIGKGTGKGTSKNPATKKTEPSKSNGLLNIAKWTSVLYVGRKLGKVTYDILKAGSDYTETLNLWETAMGNNLDIANKFVDKMNEAYGVSEKTLMNAQATFKNMLGSLGQISDETAYRLSEGVTQMALDYASLYNQTFSQAMTKFQAALAGQVRPIRSVSGFDITENTLFQLYQSLGGEKTMRQLSRTEKQLLSIYAIFEQMQASGTVGDLNKTMESFANQSRVASEQFQEIIQFSGVLLTHAIEQAGIMTYLNAILIFIGDTLKAVAESSGAIKHFGDPFASTTEGALAANEATDELNGKLLDFDKFRSLSGQQENALGIDTKLLEALSQYDSILENAGMEARELAEQFKVASGLFDKDGIFNRDSWDKLISRITVFTGILTTAIVWKKVNALVQTAEGVEKLTKVLTFIKSPLGIFITLLGYLFVTNENFRESIMILINTLAKPLSTILDIISTLLSTILNVINAIIQPIANVLAYIIKLLDNLGILEPLLYSIITILAVSKLMAIINAAGGLVTVLIQGGIAAAMFFDRIKTLLLSATDIKKWATTFKNALSDVNKQALLTKTLGIAGLTVGIMGLFYIFQNWGELNTWQKVIGLLGAITAAALGAAMAFGVFHSAWSIGLATAGIVAGIAAITAVIATSKSDISNMEASMFADGGLPDKGSMFIAGEAGAELVTNMGGGQSGVMNMEQLENAVARGMLIGLSSVDLRDDRPINVNIDGQRFFTASRDIYKRNGYDITAIR